MDPLEAKHQHFLRKISSIIEPQMRRALVHETLNSMNPMDSLWLIDQILRGSLWGENREHDAMVALADWLISTREEDDYERMQTLFRIASEHKRPWILFLLRDPPPHQSLRKGARLPEVRLPIHRDTTLGERRTLARGTNKTLWKRLLSDPNPLVLREILINPRVQLEDVLTIVSRRPTRPELLKEVVNNTKWFREAQVREALVQNPFGSTGNALRILPTLNFRVIKQLAESGALHPCIGEFATMLVELRNKQTAPLVL